MEIQITRPKQYQDKIRNYQVLVDGEELIKLKPNTKNKFKKSFIATKHLQKLISSVLELTKSLQYISSGRNFLTRNKYKSLISRDASIVGSIVDENNNSLPWNGVDSGALKVRGSWVSSSYYGLSSTPGDAGCPVDVDGWFDTGDVATVDENGYMAITDRTKDVIKSGGEWISSIDLENTAVGHPGLAECCVIGARHPKWDERPLLIIQAAPGEDPTKEEILAQLDGKIAKWWTPDDVAFIEEIPLGATGKINKLKLREIFKDYTLPTA